METTELSRSCAYDKNVQCVDRWKEKRKANIDLIWNDFEVEWHITTSKAVMDLQYQQTKKISYINGKIIDQRQIEFLVLFLYSLSIHFQCHLMTFWSLRHGIQYFVEHAWIWVSMLCIKCSKSTMETHLCSLYLTSFGNGISPQCSPLEKLQWKSFRKPEETPLCYSNVFLAIS